MMVDMLVDGGCMHGREMTQMSRVTPNNLLVSSEDSDSSLSELQGQVWTQILVTFRDAG